MKTRKFRAGHLMAILAILLSLLLSGYSFSAGRTVQLSMAFSIGAKDDNITLGSDYASSQDGGDIFVVASSGTAASAGNVTAYSPSAYMLQVTEALEDNRFLISLTNATNQAVSDRMRLLGNKKILPNTFGNFLTASAETVLLFLRAEYDDVDITTRTRWSASPVQLIIKNNGDGERGTHVSIELVK